MKTYTSDNASDKETFYVCSCCKLTFRGAIKFRAHVEVVIKELQAQLVFIAKVKT